MRILVRCTLVLTIVALLGVTLALPAVAGQRIRYEGRTSQDERISFQVLKRDSGRRFLKGMLIFMELTCEDASTERFGIGFGGLFKRLGDDGSFEVREVFDGVFGLMFELDGVVRWGSAEGTLEVNAAALTDDGTEAQLCTTGIVDWSADREGTRPIGPLAAPDDDVTMMTIDRNGDLRLIQP